MIVCVCVLMIIIYTDQRSLLVLRYSVCHNDNNVRCVAAVTCCWREQGRTNMLKCKVRVGITTRCAEISDGCLKWFDWRVGVQIKCGFNLWGIGDKTHACVTVVNVQSADKIWQERLHQIKVTCTDTCWLVHHENDVLRTIHNASCNRVVCQQFVQPEISLPSVYCLI